MPDSRFTRFWIALTIWLGRFVLELVMQIRWLLAGVLVLTCIGVTTAEPDDAAPKLRKPVAAKPVAQTWKARDVIRNGAFDYGNSAWALSGGIATATTEAGRSGDETDYGAGIEVNTTFNTNGMLAQMLHLPDKTTSGTLKLDWRIQSRGNNPTLQTLTFAIGSFDAEAQFESAAAIKQINAETFPGWDWQKIEHKLSAEEVKSINSMQASKRQLLLVVSIVGDLIRLDTDNVSLKLDGTFSAPVTPTFIAYAATNGNALEIAGVSGDGTERCSMFRSDAAESYGLAWRNDGDELAFSSTHEMAYSYFTGNLFALSATGMRRVTNPPSHAENMKDERRTGSVKLKVRNLLNENVQGAIYVEGARRLGSFTLTAFEGGADETEVEIPEVVDFGEGVLQYIVIRVGGKTAISGVTVDVVAGETVTCSGSATVDATLQHLNASAPGYTRDGKKIVFAGLSLLTVSAEGGVPTTEDFGSLIGSSPCVSPVDDSVVYTSYTGGLWRIAPGAEQGTEVLSGDSMLFAEDASWFPDGSGLVFTGRSNNQAGWGGRNLWAVTWPAKQMVQLTDLFNEDLHNPTLSPDGKWVAGIRVLTGNGSTSRQLWVWKVGEPQTCWQIETVGTPSHPAWCPK